MQWAELVGYARRREETPHKNDGRMDEETESRSASPRSGGPLSGVCSPIVVGREKWELNLDDV